MKGKELIAKSKKAYWLLLKRELVLPLAIYGALIGGIILLGYFAPVKIVNILFEEGVSNTMIIIIVVLLFSLFNNFKSDYVYGYFINEKGIRLLGVTAFGVRKAKMFDAKDIKKLELQDISRGFHQLTIHLQKSKITYIIIPNTIEKDFQERLKTDFQLKIESPNRSN